MSEFQQQINEAEVELEVKKTQVQQLEQQQPIDFMQQKSTQFLKNIKSRSSYDLDQKRMMTELAEIQFKQFEEREALKKIQDLKIAETVEKIKDKDELQKELSKVNDSNKTLSNILDKTHKLSINILMTKMNKIKVAGPSPDKPAKTNKEYLEIEKKHKAELKKVKEKRDNDFKIHEDALRTEFIAAYEKYQAERYWASLIAKNIKTLWSADDTKEDKDKKAEEFKAAHPYQSHTASMSLEKRNEYYEKLYQESRKQTVSSDSIHVENVFGLDELTPGEIKQMNKRKAYERILQDKYAAEKTKESFKNMTPLQKAIAVLQADFLAVSRGEYKLNCKLFTERAAESLLNINRSRRLLDLKIQLHTHVLSYHILAEQVWKQGSAEDNVKPKEPFIMELHFGSESYVRSQPSMVSQQIVYRNRENIFNAFVYNAIKINRIRHGQRQDMPIDQNDTFDHMATVLMKRVEGLPAWHPGCPEVLPSMLRNKTEQDAEDLYHARIFQMQVYYLDNWKGPTEPSKFTVREFIKDEPKQNEVTNDEEASSSSKPVPKPTFKDNVYESAVIPVHYFLDFDLITETEQKNKTRKRGSDLEFIRLAPDEHPSTMDDLKNKPEECKQQNTEPIEITECCCVCMGFIYKKYRENRSLNNRDTMCHSCPRIAQIKFHLCSNECAKTHNEENHSDVISKQKEAKKRMNERKRLRKQKATEEKKTLDKVFDNKLDKVDEEPTTSTEQQEAEEESKSEHNSDHEEEAEAEEDTDEDQMVLNAARSKLNKGDEFIVEIEKIWKKFIVDEITEDKKTVKGYRMFALPDTDEMGRLEITTQLNRIFPCSITASEHL